MEKVHWELGRSGPAHEVADLLLQHLDQLEQQAQDKGGIQQLLAEHFAKVYKVRLPPVAA
ncbi:MAG TPA: hypothetical protein VF807_09035 [Ktedonobacterales bacterium]